MPKVIPRAGGMMFLRYIKKSLALASSTTCSMQHLDEGAVLVDHISLENLSDVVGNAEYHLATAQDFWYALHGPDLSLMFLSKITI